MSVELQGLEKSLQRQREALQSVLANLRLQTGTWLVDYPNHLNAGDHAIWLGEQKWLGASLDGVSPTGSEMIPDDVEDVLLHGGGNLGSLYPERMKIKEDLVRKVGSRRVVHLPQSLHLEEDQAFPFSLQREQDVFLVRDFESLDRLEALGLDARLCPDPAVLLDLPRAPAGQVSLRRMDVESTSTEAKRDWLTLADWFRIAPAAVPRILRVLRPRMARAPFLTQSSKMILERNLQERLAGNLVVTDRLHASILAALAGSRVWVEPQYYDKLGRYWRAWGVE